MLVVLGVGYTGGRLRQERLRVWVPSPHVLLHSDHALQSPTGAAPKEPMEKNSKFKRVFVKMRIKVSLYGKIFCVRRNLNSSGVYKEEMFLSV